jgi:hypothetical protein
MTNVSGRSTWLGLMTLIAAVLSVGLAGDAVAKTHKGHLQAHRSIYESRAQVVPQQPARLGPMRYYGGPKSPMWRGPVEN